MPVEVAEVGDVVGDRERALDALGARLLALATAEAVLPLELAGLGVEALDVAVLAPDVELAVEDAR